MPFIDERADFEKELDACYSRWPADVSDLAAEIARRSAERPEWLPARRKALTYEVMSERCRVLVFRHLPFYFDLDAGQARHDLCSGGLARWFKQQPLGVELATAGRAWWKPCSDRGLSHGWPVLDDNHHCIGNDNVFRHGLRGLLAQVEDRKSSAADARESAELDAMAIGLRCLMRLAERFGEEAARMAASETDPLIRRRLLRIADTAPRVPADPPRTFYEALNTLAFMLETTQWMECNGVSILGHFDRILRPFYERDLAAGRITRDEAKDLISFLLAVSDVRFGMHRPGAHVGTNTTVMIGGCEPDGTPVFNDLTRMVVEAHCESRFIDPKINARISRAHPPEYFDLLAGAIASGGNSLCIFNDDVVIPANVRMGKAVEDCRLYVGGGCQENVLENTEVNSRATMYLNLAQTFLIGFAPQDWDFLVKRDGIPLASYEGCETYAAFHDVFLRNLAAVTAAHVAQRNRTEAQGWRYNPCPLQSTTLSDCIDKARDMMDGGARYNFGSISLAAIGTLIDSLYAVREVVYARRRLSLAELRAHLAADFEGQERLRQYLIRRVPKFGQENDSVRAFSAQVFADLARVTSGLPNTRGGRYEASLFAFRSFAQLSGKTGATPDGRKTGDMLSAGMSPSLLALGPRCSLGQILSSLEPLDLTQYPVVAVLDVKLPLAHTRRRAATVTPLLRRFLDAGGSVLQVNSVNPDLLLDARRHPDRHPDLVVRISGYSAYFNTLPPAVQDEVIDRTLAAT